MAYTGYRKSPNDRYWEQKRGAEKRCIPWQFTYQEWVNWWEAQLGSDWMKLRGNRTGQYVMARNGDKGPYSPANVRCSLVEDNHGEFNRNKGSQVGQKHRKKLPDDVVIVIYQMTGVYADIAKRFGLDVHSVHRIKCQKNFKKLTNGLVKGGRT